MAVRSQRVIAALLTGQDLRPSGRSRAAPARIVLPASAGSDTHDKPSVRIFVGTEAAQFRAERVLLWSIQRQRDPNRCYEIYLMKDIAGFRRLRWLTGFTNYRYAIPEFAGFQGRAIYNDVDQIYLRDPAELFDTDMQTHGVLSVNDRDTSVMLIDCARMQPHWHLRAAQTTNHHVLEARMRQQELWGVLDGGWNARDEEYRAGQSALVHYTTIHSQPWRPQPLDYVYRDNPVSELWFSREREADAARFQVFRAEQPSPDFDSSAAIASDSTDAPSNWRMQEYRRAGLDAGVRQACHLSPHRRARSCTLLALRTAAAVDSPAAGAASPSAENLLCIADGLEWLSDWDLCWWLDQAFSSATRAIMVTVDLSLARRQHCPSDPLWWYAQMVAASARYPTLHWRLALRGHNLLGLSRRQRWSGGPPLGRPPRTWVLLYAKSGHRSQALGLADAIGWPYDCHEVSAAPWRVALALFAAALGRSHRDDHGALVAPWPEVVIASGWLPGLVGRWIARRNHAGTRLILLGRKGGAIGETQDIGVACRHFRLPPEPRRIDTVLPPNKVNPERMQQAAQRWSELFTGRAQPRVVLLVGGCNRQFSLDAETAARMAAVLRRCVSHIGGSLAIVSSRRTAPSACTSMRAAAGRETVFDQWSPRHEHDNPYLGFLAGADILVVTGESESMLAEAVATGKPVYIYPIPARAAGWRERLFAFVSQQASRDRINKRGSRRPQEGLQYLCARALLSRWVVPPRDLDALHRGLVELSVARIFDGQLESWQPEPWLETQTLARQVRELLGMAGTRKDMPPLETV